MNLDAWSRQRAAFALVVVVMVTALGAIFDREWRNGDVFSPADLVFQFQPWAYDGPREFGSNPTRSDEAFYHQPLMATHFERLRSGELPDYDPSRLSGVPSFFQGLDTGRMLSPFSLPFYLMPAEDAVTVYAPLRLLVAALCMWALLRGLGLSSAAAAFGGVAYGLNGHFLTWLSAPMPTVAAWLPLGMLFVRRTVQAPSVSTAAGLAVGVGLMATGAYLATFMACMLALGVHASVELGITRRWRATPWLLGGAVGGLLLGAGALGPMLGSLVSSPAMGRVMSPAGASWANVATLAMPDFWGTPLLSNWWHPDPSANYPEHVSYFGIVVVGLAGAGVVSLLSRRHPLGVAGLLLLLLGLTRAYGAIPGRWLVWLPGQAQSNPFRWYAVVACAFAVLAALGLQALLGPAQSRDSSPGAVADTSPTSLEARWPLVAGVAAALCLLGLGVGLALSVHLPQIRALHLQEFQKAQVLRFAVFAGATLVLTALTAWGRSSRARNVTAVLLVVIAAADLAQANRRFNPTVSRERYYPSTAGLAWLAEQSVGARIAPVDATAELVEGHVWSLFGIDTVTGFDFHGDADYQRFLHAAQHPAPGPDAPPTVWDFVGLRSTTLDLRLLGLLGTRFVVTSPVDVMPQGGGYATVGELLPGRRLTFRFTPRYEGLRRVDLLTATYQRRNEGTLRVALHNAAGIELASLTVPAAELPDNDWLTLAFPPAFPSAGATFELRVEAEGTSPGAAPTVWTTASSVDMAATLTLDGADLDRALWVRTFSSAPDRVPGATLAYAGDLNVYRNPYARPGAWFVDRVNTASADRHLFEMQTRPFDSAREAWVTHAPGVSPGRPARVVSVSLDNDVRRYALEVPEGGVLVLGERAHSGWFVTIDGRPTPWQTANAVLMAVDVPPGSRLLTLEYRQPLLRPSLGLSCLAAAGIVFALLVSNRQR